MMKIHSHGYDNELGAYVVRYADGSVVPVRQAMSAILARYGVGLERDEDGETTTDEALPTEQARALRADLAALGLEATDAPDNEDRSVSWVYVTVPAEA